MPIATTSIYGIGMRRTWTPSAILQLPRKNPVILLISPYSGGISHKVFVAAPPRGLYELQAWSEGVNGISTVVADPNLIPPQKIFEFIERTQPLVIGKSLLHNTLMEDYKFMSEANIAERSPNSLVLAGGVEFTTNWHQIMPWFPVHLGVRGYGEKVTIAIAQRMQELGRRPDNLFSQFISTPGIVFKIPGRSPIALGCAPGLSADEYREKMRTFPFGEIPYEAYWDYEKSFGTNYLEGSRHFAETIRIGIEEGCRHACGFCVNPALRLAGMQQVNHLEVPDIIYLVEQASAAHPGVRAFMYDAETFLDETDESQNRIFQLCQELCERQLDRFKHLCRGRTDFTQNNRLARRTIMAMEAANFEIISYGNETDSARMLRAIHKGTRPIDNHRAVTLTSLHRVIPKLNIILFLPYKNFGKKDLIKTIEACLNWYRQGAEINLTFFIEPYPGTPVTRPDLGLKVKETVYEMVTEAGTFTYQHGEIMLPYDPVMERLAEQALEFGEEYFQQFAEEEFPGIPLEQVPKWLHNLAIFYAIYKILQRNTAEITRIIKFLKNPAPGYVDLDLEHHRHRISYAGGFGRYVECHDEVVDPMSPWKTLLRANLQTASNRILQGTSWLKNVKRIKPGQGLRSCILSAK
jgi:radical SAM superfamily enzyme YgiQ (UPF0313 family)